ncbi:MAG: hypothetical protein AABZ11_08465, partial [Nitrospinota bacterium]
MKIGIKVQSKRGYITILKRAVIILALLIPFSITIPIVEMIASCLKPCHPEPCLESSSGSISGSFSGIGVMGLTSLFSVQPAEAYTYQDVLNAYNNAKTQYPNDKIWIESVYGGYRIWRRPGKIFYYSALIYE